ncbi:MAG: DUF3307 domain-containing protein [Gemmatimonadota bacterium]|nr:DUF3307 domain-containing protein [Gemmatimonadota bacterium]
MSAEALALLAALFAAHFLGDFTPLASARMQEAKAKGAPLGPIATHAAVHAALVAAAVAAIAAPAMGLLAAVVALEFASHLALDWARGRLGARRPAMGDPSRQAFWTAVGLDQLGHALVLLVIVALVL